MLNKKIIQAYRIEVVRESEIVIPAGSRILSVLPQGNNITDGIYLYAIVDPELLNSDVNKKISICIIGTGPVGIEHEIKFDLTDYKFLGTVCFYGRMSVLHIFYQDHGYYG